MAFEEEIPDFDTLMAMCQKDPNAYEAYRHRLLREAVDNAPAEHRPELEKLLVRIENARGGAANPQEAARVAFDMMGESVQNLDRAWKRAHYAIAGVQTDLAILKARQP